MATRPDATPAASGPEDVATIEQIVEDSKATVEESRKKRGRGRPRKTPGAAKDAGAVLLKVPTPDEIKQTAKSLEGAVEIPFIGFAQGLDCEALKLDKDEREVLSMSTANLLLLYAPSMDPKTAAWLGFGSALVSISVAKVMAYQEHQSARKNQLKVVQSENNAHS
jgi:hypothetical protein